MKKIAKKLPLYRNTKTLFAIILILSILPIVNIFMKVFTGDFAFWYDPARDLLSGLSNLQKPTLIGPTTGIPGVFYGPYWIWLLSFGQLFSLDPKIVTFISLTLPYLILFPIALICFRHVIRPATLALLWMLFLLNYSNYFTDLWNPHLAPLLFLITVFLLFNQKKDLSFKNSLFIIAGGVSAGLVMNFHLSFGIGMLLGLLIYFAARTIHEVHQANKKIRVLGLSMLKLGLYLLGIAMSFMPFILFEIRHQFQQTNALFTALFQYGGVVSLQGLSQDQIIHFFFEKGANLLLIPNTLFVFIIGACSIYYYIVNKGKWDTKELRLFSILVCITLGLLSIYLTANNPVWEYHFIGVEIIFLLFIGILINKQKILKGVLFVGIILLLFRTGESVINRIDTDVIKNSGNFSAKEYVVKGIISDAGKNEYTVFAHNDAIYVYDYAYLFKLHANKDVPYDPGMTTISGDILYLIVPQDTDNKENFINFRGEDEQYRTIDTVTYPDNTLVIKKIKR